MFRVPAVGKIFDRTKIRTTQNKERRRESNAEFTSTRSRLQQSLSGSEINALKLSWRHLKGPVGLRKVSQIFVVVFQKTLKKMPQAKETFMNTAFLRSFKSDSQSIATVQDHALKLAETIEYLIGNFDSGSSDDLYLKNIGRQHGCLVKMGFSAEVWEVFGRCFADIMTRNETVRSFMNGAKAWNSLIALLTDLFRNGYEQKLRDVKYGRQSFEETGGIKVGRSLSHSNTGTNIKYNESPSKSKISRQLSKSLISLVVE